MSLAEKQALALRDLAVIVAKAKGVISGPDVYSYADSRIRIDMMLAARMCAAATRNLPEAYTEFLTHRPVPQAEAFGPNMKDRPVVAGRTKIQEAPDLDGERLATCQN